MNTRGKPATSTANTTDPQSDPEDDEQYAWLASIVVESKESVTDIHTEVPNETNQGTGTSGEPQVSSG